MLKKGDGIILCSVVALAVIGFALIKIFSANGNTVTVKKDNKIVYKGSLYENTQIKLEGNTVDISNGYAKMLNADCKNQICVKHKQISKNGESIICLPNRVIVQIN